MNRTELLQTLFFTKLFKNGDISGSDGGEFEDGFLLSCCAM
jgi:hypothetical protein